MFKRNNYRKGVFLMPRGDGTGANGIRFNDEGRCGFLRREFSAWFMRIPPWQGSFGRGRGFYARGGGRGRRGFYGVPGWQRMSGLAYDGHTHKLRRLRAEQEAEMLKNESDNLRRQLEDVQNRIASLKKVRSGTGE
jgi:hypothetical protein